MGLLSENFCGEVVPPFLCATASVDYLLFETTF